jgi:hypothetical protein
MKSDVMPSLVQLEKRELKVLCKQVKETVATEVEAPVKETSFNVADLWSVQQKMKTARGRWNKRNRTFYVRG